MTSLTSDAESYSKTAIWLHWLMAAFIVINLTLGVILTSYEGTPTWQQLLFYHGSVGSLIFLLVIYRFYWRLAHQPPALSTAMPVWEKRLAHAVHALLYLLMLTIPLTGYLHRAAGGHPVEVFGVFSWPLLIDKNLSLRIAMLNLHKLLVSLLALLIVGHIAAALKHQFIDRDNLLARMIPWFKQR